MEVKPGFRDCEVHSNALSFVVNILCITLKIFNLVISLILKYLQDPQEFHKAFSLEHKALLASQIEPLRDDVNLVVKNQQADRARIGKLETTVAKLEKGKKGVDGSFTKLAVKKFPEDVPLEERIDAMRDFMARYFPKLCATFSIRHRGDWM